jgi:predicted ATP-grasp superfamily ATP-dependent carboligase
MKKAHTRPRKILLTFARSPLALDLARQLHASGHKIVAADSIKIHISRFSNAVSKSYLVPSPSANPANYVQALLKIVREESIDFLLPLFEETACIAKYRSKFPKACAIFSPSFELFSELHNKWLFQQRLKKIGILPVPSTLIHNQEELSALAWDRPILLKACYSRGSQAIFKLSPGQLAPKLEIDPCNPWIAQEWLEGDKYCSYSICRNGSVFAHALYPVQYAIDGNSCVMFESVNHPEIYSWVCKFVKETGYTGQIAFDFIQTRDKKLYAIECNPRTTSGVHLFDQQDCLDQAFLGQNRVPLFPKTGNKKQIAMGMMLYGWKKSSHAHNNFRRFFKDFTTIKDVVYQPNDKKPFLLKPFIFAFLLKQALSSKLPLPEFFTYDHHWNGEPLGNAK